MKKNKNWSLYVLIGICSFITVYRISVVDKREISWDVLGYYLYLPATFIHDDPMLNDYSWLEKENAQNQLTGTLYMVSQNDKGEPMYFFLMGMAIFYLPFFLIGHGVAFVTGLPMDGFSPPYQYALVIGAIIYTIIGLVFLRKILKHFFSENITSLILIILIFGTNCIHHLVIKNLETVNFLFMLTTIVVWNTIKWHANYKNKHLFAILMSITFMVLIKPSEIFILFIPLLWNVVSIDDLKHKLGRLLKNKKILYVASFICLAIVAPQMIYWYLRTGVPIYDSYNNPGVGLDLFSPHIIDALFSFRKGWLIYTPVMIFSLIGFYFMYKKNRSIFYACATYFAISLYIITSWTEWWYGAAFSIRPLIVTYPVLAICLGYFIMYVSEKRVLKIIFLVLVVFFIFLNQFQWWQLKNYILDPYRTTKEYYWSTFLKKSASESDKDLLLVYRDFSGIQHFVDSTRYDKKVFLSEDFENSKEKNVFLENRNSVCRIPNDQEFYTIAEPQYKQLTKKDHLWLKVRMDVRSQKGVDGMRPCLVMTMDRKNKVYGYLASELVFDSISANWKSNEIEYLTPEIRNGKDQLKCYIWNRGKCDVDIDNLKIEIFERKY